MLSVRNVTKRYTSRTALAEISLEVEAGSTVGLLGPNATANLMSFVPREEPWTGSLALLDRLGPSLAKAPVAALASWMPFADTGLDPVLSGAALWVWAVLGCVALWISFRRVELGCSR
jgi:hypothetical protein